MPCLCSVCSDYSIIALDIVIFCGLTQLWLLDIAFFQVYTGMDIAILENVTKESRTQYHTKEQKAPTIEPQELTHETFLVLKLTFIPSVHIIHLSIMTPNWYPPSCVVCCPSRVRCKCKSRDFIGRLSTVMQYYCWRKK